MCKYTAAAILAKVYAQDTESGTCDWQKVKEWAKKVIDSNNYSLYPKCQDMAKIDNNNKYESILAIQCSTANNNAHINWSNLLNVTYSDGNLYGTGDDFFYGSQDLVDAFATDGKCSPAPRLHRGPNRLPLPRTHLHKGLVPGIRHLWRIL